MSDRVTRILVVANRTAAAPRLLDEVRRRAEQSSCRFALLIPDVRVRGAADWTMEIALPLLQRAAKSKVEGIIGGPEPLESIRQALADGEYDEIIVSTLPKHFSRWLRQDLITQIERLGLPVTVITPRKQQPTSDDNMHDVARIGGGGMLSG
jgi:GABA permease